ncbi:hypothetical protein MASR2M70_03290 [Bacillota bacterium]
MNLYTIGFTKKTAEQFFEQLKKANINLLLDIRLNNKSQLAGFAKGADLRYFLKEICNAEYYHDTYLSPTEEILKDYRDKKISWEEYEIRFKNLMEGREIDKYFLRKYYADNSKLCLLCSEDLPDNCHRRLIAEYVAKKSLKNISVVHL